MWPLGDGEETTSVHSSVTPGVRAIGVFLVGWVRGTHRSEAVTLGVRALLLVMTVHWGRRGTSGTQLATVRSYVVRTEGQGAGRWSGLGLIGLHKEEGSLTNPG